MKHIYKIIAQGTVASIAVLGPPAAHSEEKVDEIALEKVPSAETLQHACAYANRSAMDQVRCLNALVSAVDNQVAIVKHAVLIAEADDEQALKRQLRTKWQCVQSGTGLGRLKAELPDFASQLEVPNHPGNKAAASELYNLFQQYITKMGVCFADAAALAPAGSDAANAVGNAGQALKDLTKGLGLNTNITLPPVSRSLL